MRSRWEGLALLRTAKKNAEAGDFERYCLFYKRGMSRKIILPRLKVEKRFLTSSPWGRVETLASDVS